jgi:lactate dehydrogenase-like 2-hydroxyacid dehydrogenase
VNSEDLAEALENVRFGGAGLDVITGEPDIDGNHPFGQGEELFVSHRPILCDY